ncbi:MAG: translocation/assembly module TamB domain-containing protein [Gemmatimonadales bacterium]
MRRLVSRVLFVGLTAVLAAALGTLAALVSTAPGRDLLARLVTEQSGRFVRGTVSIARIDGDFRRHLVLDSVVVRDTSGVLLADVERIELQFSLASFLARRVVFSSIRAIRPEIHVIKHREGRMNFQEVLRLGERTGEGGGGPSPLIQFNGLELVDGRIELYTPWNPDGRLHTERQRDSALAAERRRPGRRIVAGPPAEGYQQVRLFEQVHLRFPELTVSSPDGRPLHGTIDTLSVRVSDPAVTVIDLGGSIEQGADSLVFELEHAALPNTRLSGAGRIDWPRDTILYDFTMDAREVDLVDLRWIQPDFPALTGRGRATARSIAGSRAEFDLRNLDLAGGGSRVQGGGVAIVDVYRGLGFRGLDLVLTDLDLETVRPFLDTLPVYGRITGPLRASGFFDEMTVDFDWRFDDARVEGEPSSWLALSGPVRLGGPDGVEFHEATLENADLDLRTVRLLAPAVRLDGRLVLGGRLDGPWRLVTFQGQAIHSDLGRPPSRITGTATLDTRGEVLGVDASLTLDSLAFDGIRGTFPEATLQGSLGGRARLVGTLDRLQVDAEVGGQIGQVVARGAVALQSPRFEADALDLEFSRADLAALKPGWPATVLAGHLRVSGVIDSAAPRGAAVLTLGRGSIREAPLDSARTAITVADRLLTVDTARVWWPAGEAFANGSLGWDESREGTIQGEAIALALSAFDTLALRVAGRSREEAAEGDLLAGRARGRFTLTGSLDRWGLETTAQADSVRWLDYFARGGNGRVVASGGRLDPLRYRATAMVDSVAVGDYVVLGVDGAAESLDRERTLWRLAAALPNVRRVALSGVRTLGDSGSTIAIDSASAWILDRPWRLVRPVTLAMREEAIGIDSMRLVTDDGGGVIRLYGDLPGRQAARLQVNAFGIGLQELYALAQRDTTGVAGQVALDGRIEGTKNAPRLRGSGAVTGAVLGEFRAPLVRGVFNYDERRLQSNLTFWRTGDPVLNVDASLPLDLSFGAVARRQIPGTLTIRGQADSVDLAVIEAFTQNLRSVGGTAAVDVRIQGSWDEPRLAGAVAFREGSARVPGLGVRYRDLNGRVRLSGDSLIADTLRVRDDDGVGFLQVTGGIELERLTRPILDLRILSEDFRFINARDYLTLEAATEVALTGPLERPVLTGSATATNSVLYFADLIAKDIVNLEDPMNADLVDTTMLRAQDLGAQFQSRFLDSLQIRDLRFRVGEGVWLRSNEANLQLEGRVTVNKERWTPRAREYRVSGEFQTPRGTYTLKLGPVFRTFTVEQGTLRYFNTADLDAQIDIEARRVVRAVGSEREEYPIIAKVTGTLLAPKLALTLPADRAPLSERDLLALLITGAPAGSLFRPQGSLQADEVGWSIGSTVLSSELQRALIGDAGGGRVFDLVEIRPGFAQGNSLFAGSGNVTTLAFGRQLASKLFAIFSAGACFSGDAFSYKYFGASLEYRLHPTLRFQLSAEPVQSCLSQTAQAFGAGSIYQFATDLRWDREY